MLATISNPCDCFDPPYRVENGRFYGKRVVKVYDFEQEKFVRADQRPDLTVMGLEESTTSADFQAASESDSKGNVSQNF